MKKRAAIALVSFASLAGAPDIRAGEDGVRAVLRFEVTVVLESPAPAAEVPNPGDLKRLGERDLALLSSAGASARDLAPRGARLYKDRKGEVYALPASRRRGARPRPAGWNLREV